MSDYSMQELAAITRGQFIGENRIIKSISTRSGQQAEQSLFIPIKGERFDGHDFIADAIDHGAVAVLSEKKTDTEVPYILVKNTRAALGQIAADYRKGFKNPIIGLTGSMGKTTTKAMIASILLQQHSVLSPESSMNNDVGVPLTLLQLDGQDFAVIEIGTNHVGEIEYLTGLVRPDVALITNIGSAHLEAFRDLEGVAKEKATIFSGLKNNGIAVINADDPHIRNLKNRADIHHSAVSFGYSPDADIRALDIQLNDLGQAEFTLEYGKFSSRIQLQCFGEHNVKNALAAAAVASIFDISPEDIKAGLEKVEPVAKRLRRLSGLNGSIVIDDSYSAIPDAVMAALRVLACARGEKIFIFGGMAELNPDEKIAWHDRVGREAKALGINRLFTVGDPGRHTAVQFGESAQHFNDRNELIQAVKNLLRPGVTVLVKGSRSMHLEDVVNEISEGK